MGGLKLTYNITFIRKISFNQGWKTGALTDPLIQSIIATESTSIHPQNLKTTAFRPSQKLRLALYKELKMRASSTYPYDL